MRQHQAFDIAFGGLKNGQYHFDYNLDKTFFESFSPPDFQESALSVHLKMDKKERLLLLNFEITGTIKVICDRCGDLFNMDIWDEFPFVVKKVYDVSLMDEKEDEDPNVAYIDQNESILNVAKWAYEFALLSIPMQRIHPEGAKGESGCNSDTLRRLEQMKENNEDKSNPVWKGLEQFKNK